MKKFMAKMAAKATMAKQALAEKANETKAEGYVDSGVKILIAVVIGALLLAGLYYLMNSVILPKTASKVTTLFDTNNQVAGTYEIPAAS